MLSIFRAIARELCEFFGFSKFVVLNIFGFIIVCVDIFVYACKYLIEPFCNFNMISLHCVMWTCLKLLFSRLVLIFRRWFHVFPPKMGLLEVWIMIFMFTFGWFWRHFFHVGFGQMFIVWSAQTARSSIHCYLPIFLGNNTLLFFSFVRCDTNNLRKNMAKTSIWKIT